jgi:hypothetical protein
MYFYTKSPKEKEGERMRKIPDEFQRDDVNGEHLINDEFSFLNETEEYDERFFHRDEYNRDCYIGLSNEKFDEMSNEAESVVKNFRPKPSIFVKAFDSLRTLAFVLALGTVVLAGPIIDGDIPLLDNQNEHQEDDVPVVSVDHSHIASDNWDIISESTCSTSGKKVLLCAECNEVMYTETIPVTEHVSGNWITEKQANCSEKGIESKFCTFCNEKIESRETPLGTHILSNMITDVDSTCTKIGSGHKECVICKTVLEKGSISLKEHKELVVDGKSATCSENGYTESSKCSECNKTLKERQEIPATNQHSTITVNGVDATCTESGYTSSSYCSDCNKVLAEKTEIPATGHKEIITAGKEPTCTESGYTESSNCSECGEQIKSSTTIPATGHKEVVTAGKEPTCTESGYTESSRCSKCGEQIKSSTLIPATGHNEVVTEGKEPTCTE